MLTSVGEHLPSDLLVCFCDETAGDPVEFGGLLDAADMTAVRDGLQGKGGDSGAEPADPGEEQVVFAAGDKKHADPVRAERIDILLEPASAYVHGRDPLPEGGRFHFAGFPDKDLPGLFVARFWHNDLCEHGIREADGHEALQDIGTHEQETAPRLQIDNAAGEYEGADLIGIEERILQCDDRAQRHGNDMDIVDMFFLDQLMDADGRACQRRAVS